MPVPLPTRRGSLVAHVGDGAWTLCRHVAGERLGDELSSYRPPVALLAVAHRGLRDLDPRCAVMPGSLVDRARDALRDTPRPLASAMPAAAAWLHGRLAALEALPRQVIHGDFGIPNVLVAKADPPRFGLLDWELSSYDSPVFDLAQVAFGMIAFSRDRPPPDLLGLLTRWYAEDGGQTFTAGQLAAALVAGRLAHLAWLHGRGARWPSRGARASSTSAWHGRSGG